MQPVSFSGGDKLQARLRDIVQKASRSKTLDVGFFSDATEADGTLVSVIAASNEFGATIPARQVDEHVIQIYNRVLKDGSFADEGRFVKRSKANLERDVTVPAHIIPEHKVPPRPFFRRMISLGKKHWGDDLGKIMVAVNYDATLALSQLGEKMAGELVQSITDQVYAPLAQSTVAKKGFDTTLVDSADMKRAVDFQIT